MSDVGEIVGRLRLDTSAWFAELSRAEAKARELSGVDPKVTVKTEGVAKAVTELEAVKVAEDRIDDANERTARSSAKLTGEARRQADAMAYLVKGLVAIGPAIVPAGAAAVGVTAAFGGLATAGVVAILGIQREMTAGTATGLAYRSVFTGLLDDAHRLEASAARGLFPGVEQSAGVLQAAMPMLNRELDTFTRQLAQILPTGVDALVTGLTKAEPLLDASGQMLVKWVGALDDAAHSKGFENFITYAVANLPRLEELLGSALQLAGDFLGAMAPYGDDVLTVVTGLLRLADALTPIAPLIWGVWTAFAAWRALSPLIGGISSKLVALGTTATVTGGEVAAGGAAAKAGGLAAAAGWTAALLALTQYADHAAAGANYDNAYALTKGNAKKKSDVAAAASNASMVAPQTAGGGGMAIPGLLDQAATSQHKLAASTREAVAAEQQQAATSNTLRAQLNAATSAADALIAAQDKASASAIGLEGSYDGARDSIHNVTTAVEANVKAHVKNATSLNQDTSAGRANREQILAAVQAIKAHGAEMVKNGAASSEAKVSQDKLAVSLVNAAVKAGISRRAAEAYIGKLLGIPKGVSTSVQLKKDQAEARLAAYRREVQALDGYVATVYVSLREVGLDPGRAAQVAKNPGLRGATGGTTGAGDFGTIPRMAGGGSIIGPGTASNDLAGIYRLANGEEVVSNLFGGAAAMRPFLKAVSAGKVKTRAQAAEALGIGGQQSLRMHFTDDGSILGQAMRQGAEQAIAAQQARDARTQRMGFQGKGLLAAPTGA